MLPFSAPVSPLVEPPCSDDLSDILERGPTVAYARAPDGRIGFSYVSPNCFDLLGYAASDVAGDLSFLTSRLHPDDRESALEGGARAARQGRSVQEYRLRHADGRYLWLRDEAKLVYDEAGKPKAIYGTWVDVTTYKEREAALELERAELAHELKASARTLERAEHAAQQAVEPEPDSRAAERLAQSEAELKLIADSNPALIARYDRDCRYLFVNRAYREIVGEGADRLVGRTIAEVWGDDYYQRRLPHIERVLAGEPQNFEGLWGPEGEGGKRWAAINYVPERGPDGSVIGFIVFSLDVTELREAKRAIERRENDLKAINDAVPALVARLDRQFRYRYLNAYFRELIGDKAENALGRTFRQVFGKEVYHDREPYLKRALAGETVRFENMLTDLSGEPRIFIHTYTPEHDANGEVDGIYVFGIDITEQRRAEDKLRDSDREIRLINDAIPAFVTRLDREFRYRYLNAHVRRLMGEKFETAIGKTPREVFGDELFANREPFLKRALAGESVHMEVPVVDARGQKRILSQSYIPGRDARGEVDGLYVFANDITKQRRAEEKLRASEREIRLINDALPAYVTRLDRDLRYRYLNAYARRLMGEKFEGAIGRTPREVFGEEFFAHREPYIRRALAGETVRMEVQMLDAEGMQRTLLQVYIPERDVNGDIDGLYIFANDITEQRRVEDRLRESEREIRVINDAVPLAITRFSDDGRLLYGNAYYLQLHGKTPDELIGKKIDDYLSPETAAIRRPYVARCLAGETLTFEAEFYSSVAGKRILRRSYLPEVSPDGKVRSFVAIALDVTEQRGAEEKLHASEREIRLINDAAPLSIARIGRDGRLLYANAFYERLHGLPLASMIGRKTDEYIDPEVEQMRRPHVARCLAGETVTYEGPFFSSDLGERTLRRTYVPVPNAVGEIDSFIGIAVDTTEQHRVLQALRQSEQRLSEAQSAARIGSYEWDIEGEELWWSDMAYRIMGLDPAADQACYHAFIQAIHPDDRERVKAEQRAAVKREGVTEIEFRIVMPGGEVRHLLSRGSFVRGADGRALRKVGTIQDITEREQAELAIKASEAKYRRLHETIIDAFSSVDMSGKYVEVNRSFQELTGYSEEELHRITYEDLTPEKWRAMEARIVDEQVLKCGYSDIYEKEYRRKDGTIVPIELRTVVMRGDDGEPSGMWAIVRDISERKRAEEALTQFKSALDQTSDCVFMFDPGSLRFVYVNRGATEQVGYGEAELLNLTPVDLKPEFDWAKFRQLIQPLIDGKQKTLRFETVHQHEDGHLVPVDIGLQLVWVSPSHSLFVAIVRDISERKRIERDLHESGARLREAHRIAKLSHWSIDIASRKLERLEGALTPETSGHGIGTSSMDVEFLLERAHPDDRANVEQALKSAMSGEGAYDIEHRMIRADGSVQHVHAQGELVRDEDGKPVRLIGTVQDVTERRQLEEQLRRSQRLEAIGRLTGGVAHDFNNLLGVLVGNLDLLELQLADRPEAQALLRRATEAAQRGASLTQRLLSYGRRQTLLPENLNTGAFVQDLSTLLHRALGENIDVVTTASDEALHCSVDPGQLEAAILNLAINSREAMPEGGELSIEVRREWVGARAQWRNPEAKPGDYVVIEVKDTGVGMPADVRQRATEPFYTTKEIGKGSGLGLSMIHGFVHQSGGFMAIQSEVGRGTTVTLYLPAVASSRLSTTPTPSVTRSAG